MIDRQTYMPCKVDGCDRNAHYKAGGANGYCYSHNYRNERHGSPFGGRISPGEATRFLREVVLPYQGSGCLIWPYARNSAGYGHLSLNGRDTLVHRAACENRTGPPPAESAVAAHSCGNGHLGCCNPAHLRWATTQENNTDKQAHGTQPKGETCAASKLTAAQVIEIRRRISAGERQRAVARDFSIDQANVSAIVTRRTWRHVA